MNRRMQVVFNFIEINCRWYELSFSRRGEKMIAHLFIRWIGSPSWDMIIADILLFCSILIGRTLPSLFVKDHTDPSWSLNDYFEIGRCDVGNVQTNTTAANRILENWHNPKPFCPVETGTETDKWWPSPWWVIVRLSSDTTDSELWLELMNDTKLRFGVKIHGLYWHFGFGSVRWRQ